MINLTKRQQWVLFAATASAAAAPIAERALVAAWRSAVGDEPPEDPAGPDVDWWRDIAWTTAAAVAVTVAQVVARRGAALVWERTTGEKPPQARTARRKRRLPRR